MGYIDSLFPVTDEPTNFQAVMATHRKNGVPTSAWVSLINVGLSLTHFVSEAFATGANLWRGIARGLFADTLLADAQSAPDAATLATVTTYADGFAQSQYQESLQPASFAILRVQLSSVSTAPPYTFAAGQVLVGTPSINVPLLFTLTELAQLAPGGVIEVLCKAASPGAVYNLSTAAPFEMKTTFVGVTASLPASGQRVTFGTGNAALQISLCDMPTFTSGFTTIVPAIVLFTILAPGANNPALTFQISITLPSTVNLTVNLKTDGANASQSTVEDVRRLLTPLTLIFAGVQALLPGDGTQLLQPATVVSMPLATTPVDTAGQNTELAVNLIPRCTAKWDALEVGSGTDDALYYWATLAPAGYTTSPVSQVSVLNITKPDGSISGGYVTVLVSGPTGPLSTADLTAVQGNMLNPRKNAAFTVLTVVNTVAHNITVTAAVTYLKSSKLADADIAADIAASLLSLQALLRMGVQSIDQSRVEGFIVAASTAITIVAMNAPAAPTVLAWNERAVFVMSGFTYTAV